MSFVYYKKIRLGLFLCAVLPMLVAPTRGFPQQAQENILYSFCSVSKCADGSGPEGKLLFDRAGSLYGTTLRGGIYASGTVFELSPSSNGAWTESVLYSFCVNQNCPDGANPAAGLIKDQAGRLYGTTQVGGNYGQGTVFQLTPPSGQGNSWTETVLWSFGGTGDGRQPFSDLILDASGRLYGTTADGGAYQGGTVFRLVPHVGEQWSEDLLLSFGPETSGGYDPQAGVTFDYAGSLFGTTMEGGSSGLGHGVVYELTPNSQPPWTETVLHKFEVNGNPRSTVDFDASGNFYGTVSDAGGVYKITPQGEYRQLLFGAADGPSVPYAGVFLHGETIYGTTAIGGAQGSGTVFQVQGAKTIVLYSFCSQPGCGDGAAPSAAVVGHDGNLYGTTSQGGVGANGGGGVVFQISSSALRAQLKTAPTGTTGSRKIPASPNSSQAR